MENESTVGEVDSMFEVVVEEAPVVSPRQDVGH